MKNDKIIYLDEFKEDVAKCQDALSRFMEYTMEYYSGGQTDKNLKRKIEFYRKEVKRLYEKVNI